MALCCIVVQLFEVENVVTSKSNLRALKVIENGTIGKGGMISYSTFIANMAVLTQSRV